VQRYLGELLEALDKVRPKSLTLDELHQKGIPTDTILDAMDRDLIRAHSRRYEKENVHGKMPYNLTGNGFELLNQVRMKKAIDDLDESINNFKNSNERAYNQLNQSIIKFNESSDNSAKMMELYTARLVYFTWLLVVLTIALLIIPPETPQQVKYIGVIFVFIIAIIIFRLKKN